MKHLFLSLFAVFLAFALPVGDADAKRFGGGKSSGMQRDASSYRQTPPQRSPEAAPAQANPAGAAGAAAGQAGKRSWMGPIAGLAAGLGLAALASHFGFGEELANFLMIALLALAAVMAFRYFTRSRERSAQPMRYAANAPFDGSMPEAAPAPMPMASSATPTVRPLPAGFDAEAFTRQAKLNFLRLQAAYDAADLDDIREFTSPEMFAEIKLQIAERGATQQRTDVINVEANVLECLEEADRYVVSVRFYGAVREEAGAEPVPFDEVWHLTKPAQGERGWVIAGIQQIG